MDDEDISCHRGDDNIDLSLFIFFSQEGGNVRFKLIMVDPDVLDQLVSSFVLALIQRNVEILAKTQGVIKPK